MRGATARNRAGSHRRNRSGGSTTWSSTEMSGGTSANMSGTGILSIIVLIRPVRKGGSPMSIAAVPSADWLASEQLPVAALLEDRAGKSPDVTALWLDDVGYTFADLAHRSRAAASALLALGARPGEAVALLLESCIELVDVWLGAAAAGIVSVPVNIANRGDFLVHQLCDSGAVAVLADPTTVDPVRAIAAELAALRLVVVVGDVGDGWPSHLQVVSSDVLAGDPAQLWPDG